MNLTFRTRSGLVAIAVLCFSLPRVAHALADETAPERMPPAAQGRSEIKGRLVFRRADKSLAPISDAIVYVGMGDVSCLEPYQRPKDAKFRADGSFSFALDEQHTWSRWVDVEPNGSSREPYCTEEVSYGCYRIKAKGCEDLVIRYDPKMVLGDLFVMKCRDRQ